MVDAWHCGNGAEVYRNSSLTMAGWAVGRLRLKWWRPEPTRLTSPPGRHTSATVLQGTSTVQSSRCRVLRQLLATRP